jgi:copper chaperone CopZ
MKTAMIRIGGMTCKNCQHRIERELKGTVGVENADAHFGDGTAAVTYNASVVTMREITEAIEKLDYQVLEGEHKTDFLCIAGTAIIILSLYALLQGLGINAPTSAFPLAEAGINFDPINSLLAAFNPFAVSKSGAAKAGAFEPVIENGCRIVNSSLSGGRYPAITVQRGIPVKWRINAPRGALTAVTTA